MSFTIKRGQRLLVYRESLNVGGKSCKARQKQVEISSSYQYEKMGLER